MNAAYYPGERFDQVSGPSYREIIDLGHWDDSVVANVPGESGQPGSPHYADLAPLWDQTQYFPMLYSQSAVEQAEMRPLMVVIPHELLQVSDAQFGTTWVPHQKVFCAPGDASRTSNCLDGLGQKTCSSVGSALCRSQRRQLLAPAR